MLINNIEVLKNHAKECYPFECCGIVINNEYIPQKNISENFVDCFRMDDAIYFQYEKDLQAVIHSHTQQELFIDPRTPSLEDMQGAEATQVPWGIVYCDGENITEILWFNDEDITELVGRPYIHNVYDCFTLGRDYYRLLGIESGIYPRPVEWEKWNIHYIWDCLMEFDKFRELKPSEELKAHDVLLLKLGSRYPTHFCIYIGNGEILHHLYKRKSSKEPLEKWKRLIANRLRFTGEFNDQA